MIRTVSMLPAATEIVGALGLMDHLVAVSHECDYPEEAKRRPRVTHCEIHGKGLPSEWCQMGCQMVSLHFSRST